LGGTTALVAQGGVNLANQGGTGIIASGGGGAGSGAVGGIGVLAQGGTSQFQTGGVGIFAFRGTRTDVNPAFDGLAGYFSGNVQITGTISKGGGSFKIDHPLDPENKYLYHSFIESPDIFTSPSQRLDLVLIRGPITAQDADVVGEDPILDITPSGLRPSDHAGVTADLVLQP